MIFAINEKVKLTEQAEKDFLKDESRKGKVYTVSGMDVKNRLYSLSIDGILHLSNVGQHSLEEVVGD